MTCCLILALAACTSKEGDDTGAGPGDTDSGETTDTIDTSGDPEITNLTVTTAAQMTTVITVEWDTPEAGNAWVEYGPNDSYGFATTKGTEGGTHHKVIVAGFPFSSDWHWRAVSTLSSGDVASADQVHTSDQKPPGLATYDMEIDDAAAVEPGFRIVPYLGSPSGIFVVNDAGVLVWYKEFEDPEGTLDVILAPDGSGIYYMIGDVTRRTDIGEVVYERWDLEESSSARAEWAHHDFQVLPDGSYAFISADIRNVRGADYEVAGDAVILMDRDGSNARSIWNSWDALEEPDFSDCRPEFYPNYCDWTHANGLWYDAADDTLLLSLHNENSFAKLQMDGSVDWYLGTADFADITPTDEASGFVHQHGVNRIDTNTYLLFDNGDFQGDHSRMLRIVADPSAHDFTADWIWEWDSRHSSVLLGDHNLLPNGNHLGSWGSEAVVTETTEAQELVWQMVFDIGVSTAFTSYAPGLGGVLP